MIKAYTSADYIHDHRLDQTAYQTVKAIKPVGDDYDMKDWILLMRSSRPDEVMPYCVQFRGGGKYFPDLPAAAGYIAIRWGYDAKRNSGIRLRLYDDLVQGV